jgi:hypothetical protein
MKIMGLRKASCRVLVRLITKICLIQAGKALSIPSILVVGLLAIISRDIHR